MAENGLSEGWSETTLGICVDVLDNLRVPVNSDERKRRPGSIPYYGATQQVGWIDDYIFDEELVLLGEDGAPFLDKSKPIAYIIEGKSWVNNHAHVLRAIAGLSSNHYVKHLLDAADFAPFVGGTTRLKLNQGKMRNIPVPLPPLAEQKRIVAMVGKLLERVNAARGRLSKVPTIIKRFRQSVLAAACSGRLTADWRDAHPDIEPVRELVKRVLDARREESGTNDSPRKYRHPRDVSTDRLPTVPTTWRYVSSDSLFSFVTSGSRGWAKYYSDDGPLFLRIGNLDHDSIDLDLTQVQRVSPPAGAERQRTVVRAGDILVSVTADVGMIGLVPDDVSEAYVNQHVAIARPVAGVFRPYLAWFLATPDAGQTQFREMQRGMTKVGLGLTDIRSVAVAFPPLDEQHEIVRRVEALFKLADAIEGRVAAGTQRADKLTQSILAKTFRGELVPTEAELARQEGRSYEPASVLLERIKAEREAVGATKPKRGGKRRRKKSATAAKPDEQSDADEKSLSPTPEKPEPTRRRRQPEPSAEPAPSRRADHDGRRDIDDYETDEVMAVFRQVYRGRAKMPEDELLRETARRFGFGRLGSWIKDRLKGHLRAAIRRKILVRKRDIIELETFHMEEYTRDELVDAIDSVMVKGREYERDEVIDAVARYLGFTRLRDTVIAPIKSAINAAIRRGAATSTGRAIRR